MKKEDFEDPVAREIFEEGMRRVSVVKVLMWIFVGLVLLGFLIDLLSS